MEMISTRRRRRHEEEEEETLYSYSWPRRRRKRGSFQPWQALVVVLLVLVYAQTRATTTSKQRTSVAQAFQQHSVARVNDPTRHFFQLPDSSSPIKRRKMMLLPEIIALDAPAAAAANTVTLATPTSVVGSPFVFSLADHASGGGSSPLSAIVDIVKSEERPFQYAFMLPVQTAVAVLCQSAGIGGAALLSPLFLLVFPLLGPDYPLSSPAAAIATALLTEVFGFTSGLSGYWRAGLVDWEAATGFLKFAVPAALAGALIEPSLASETSLLRFLYATLMFTISAYIVVSEKAAEIPDDCPIPDEGSDDDDDSLYRSTIAADGTVYTYLKRPSTAGAAADGEPMIGSGGALWKSATATTAGAGLTGLLGVGIGEVVLPQLVKWQCMPGPVAAGTSVAVVVVTALTAAVVQFVSLAADLSVSNPNLGLVAAFGKVVPWSLVQYTIPGAILGGQIAPLIVSKQLVDDETLEMAVAVIFATIGVAFAIKAIVG